MLFQPQKRISAQAGLRFSLPIKKSPLTQYCHSVGNQTKWFDEINLNGRDSYGMTKLMVYPLHSEAPFVNLNIFSVMKKKSLQTLRSKLKYKYFPYFCKNQILEDKQNNPSSALRKYGKYSSVVFQMLFIIGISFWGGHQLDLYFETGSNVLVLVIGLSGLCLALYTTLKRLEILNKEENEEQK